MTSRVLDRVALFPLVMPLLVEVLALLCLLIVSFRCNLAFLLMTDKHVKEAPNTEPTTASTTTTAAVLACGTLDRHATYGRGEARDIG